MNERDMFYSNYGYAGMMPPNMMMQGMQMPYQMTPNQDISPNSNIDIRIANIEKQLNRLNARVTRLENPYGNTTNLKEPDNNMYMI